MADFDTAIAFILDQEGGLVNNPEDPGKLTKYGISQAAYPTVDIANLTVDDAKAIYRRDYWTPMGCDGMADPWALLALDSAVQHGIPEARLLLQSNRIADALWHRVRFYDQLKTFNTFGRGWVKRMADLRDTLVKLYGVPC